MNSKELEHIKRKLTNRNPVEEQWWSDGLPCFVLMNTNGNRCGYVGIPMESLLFERHYNDVEDGLSVHGGLTFSGQMAFLADNELYYFHAFNVVKFWWFGFDCGHAGDAADFKTALRYFKDTEHEKTLIYLREVHEKYPINGSIKSTSYVIENCDLLANQLQEYTRKLNSMLAEGTGI